VEGVRLVDESKVYVLLPPTSLLGGVVAMGISEYG
jgi:hypothetical protein